MKIETNKFLTVAEAAAMLGTKEMTIRVYITTGRLESVIKDGRRMIASEEIRRYIIEKENSFKKGGFTKKKLRSNQDDELKNKKLCLKQ